MKITSLLKYAGLALGAFFILPKILKSGTTKTPEGYSGEADPNASPPGKLSIKNVFYQKESVTDKGARFTIYIVVHNPFIEPVTADIEGNLVYGIIPFVPITMKQKLLKADGDTVLSIQYIQAYSALPTAMRNILSSNKNTLEGLLTSVNFDGDLVYNKTRTKFATKMKIYDASKISGLRDKISEIRTIIGNRL